MKSFEFPHKKQMGINLKSEEDKIKILEFLKQDSFEYHYLNQDCINILDDDRFYKYDQNGSGLISYNGKYDGDMKGLLNFASENNIEISIICNEGDEDYMSLTYYDNFKDTYIRTKINDIIKSKSKTKADDIMCIISEFLK